MGSEHREDEEDKHCDNGKEDVKDNNDNEEPGEK